MAKPERSSAGPADVVMACDGRLVTHLGATALALARAASVPCRFWFLTTEGDYRDSRWGLVVRALAELNVDSNVVSVALANGRLQLARHLTVATYLRLLLPEVLPELDRALYFDCDIWAGRDLADLWNEPLEGCAVGAVEDHGFSEWDRVGLSTEQGYFNAGVLKLDLVEVKRTGVFKNALKVAREYPERLAYSDQCALNIALAGNWKRLSPRWNYQQNRFLQDVENHGYCAAFSLAATSVFHFTGYDKPWLPGSAHPLRHAWRAGGQPLTDIAPATWRQRLGYVRRVLQWQAVQRGLRSAYRIH